MDLSFRDKQLIKQFKRGQNEALAVIYDRYVGLLLKVADGLTNNPDTAEDIVHDVFVKFAQSAETLKLQGSLKAYLITCVTNRARDRWRKLTPAIEPGEASTNAGPQQKAMQRETRHRIHQALAKLPDQQREVIILRLQANMKFHEIARMLSVSINTVQSRYRYGIEKLKHLLNGELKP